MNPWTDDEDAYIESRWGHFTDRELATALGRTEVAVGSRRAQLRMLRADKGSRHLHVRQWMQEEDELLMRLFEEGRADDDIGEQVGRTRGAISQRRSTLGLTKASPITQKPERLWTREEDQVLGWMFRQGWGDQRIGEAMEKTACAIKDRRQSLGLWRAKRR
jgi:hypothetical protein